MTHRLTDARRTWSANGARLAVVVVLAVLVGATQGPAPTAWADPPTPDTAAAAPLVSQLQPTKGLGAGGTLVTITGTGFTGATAVRFGATNPAATFTVLSDTQISAVAPPPPVVPAPTTTVNVFVDTPSGSSTSGVPSWYRYVAAPAITGVSPAVSSYEGGQRVTVSVADLDAVDRTLLVDGTPVADVLWHGGSPPTAASFTTPPHLAGPASVTVVSTGGTSAPATLTYLAAPLPRVAGVSPTSGPWIGGTTVTITGTGFTDATTVWLGSQQTAPTVVSDTELTVVTPHASSDGPAWIRVVTPAGTTPDGARVHFTYELGEAPRVDSIAPAAGPTSGGTLTVVRGAGLIGVTDVRFGGVSAPWFLQRDSTTVDVATPPHAAATVAVEVEVSDGTLEGPRTIAAGDLTFEFADDAPATVSGMTPRHGPTAGGTVVVLTGSGFTGTTQVRFGPTAVSPSVTVDSDTRLTVVAPPGVAGTTNVWITTPWGTSASSERSWFGYVAPPVVTTMTPPGGPSTGGTTVRLVGTGLVDATAVWFGDVPAPTFHWDGGCCADPGLVAEVPPLPTGPVAVHVDGPWGPSAPITYVVTDPGVPVLWSMGPTTGPDVGGTVLYLTGDALTGTTGVRFGDVPAASFTVLSPSQLRVVAPPHAVGTVPVTLEHAGGDAPVTADFTFTVQPPPTTSWITPQTGSELGGTLVTIQGTALLGTTSVEFGAGNPATSFTIVSDQRIDVVAPPAATLGTGMVNVFVTTPKGTTPAGRVFTYTGPPTVTSVSPELGRVSGGTVVTITGARFNAATAVRFGTKVSPSFTVVNGNQLRAVVPAGTAGETVAVTVTSSHGTSVATGASTFRYVAVPIIVSLSVRQVTTAGGTAVTVHGTALADATAVHVGGQPADFAVVDDATLVVTTPPRAPGPATITVTTPGGVSETTLATVLTYVAPGAPTITSLTPNRSSISGGGTVTVVGTGFSGATAVAVGWGGATTFTVISDTELVLDVPPRADPGLVNIWVRTPAGTSANGPTSWFLYQAP